MRRRLAVLVTTLVTLVVAAAPAVAAESQSAAGDEDLWTGMILAFVLGLVAGIGVFVDTSTGAGGATDASH